MSRYSFKKYYYLVCVCFVWGFVSLFYSVSFILKQGNYNLTASFADLFSTSQFVTLVISFIIAQYLIFLFISFLYKAISSKGKERQIILCTLPILIYLTYKFIKTVNESDTPGFYFGDEKNIWYAAVNLYPYLFVYTSEFFIISFLIIPSVLAPTIVKLVFSSFVLGYVVHRIKSHFNNNYAFLLYFLYFLIPFSDLCLKVHRMHWYSFFYLLFAVKIYFDIKERKEHNSVFFSIIAMSFCCALLTILRREGIYFLLLGPVFLLMAYGNTQKNENKVTRKNSIIIISFIIFSLSLWSHEFFQKSSFQEKYTTYQAFLVHMLKEETLDRNKISVELNNINKIMDIERIDKYNAKFGDLTYEDCHFGWEWWNNGEYYAIRTVPIDGFTWQEFATNVVSIIKKAPMSFFKTRFTAFKMVYSLDDHKIKSFLYFYVPFFILIFSFIFSLIVRNLPLFLLNTCLLLHTVETTIFMPASYLKYYYQLVLFSWVNLLICFCEFKKRVKQ